MAALRLDRFSASTKLYNLSRRYLAGGVSSGMRSACKPLPLFFEHAAGSHLRDVDGNEYIDYTLAWGPMILGHSHPGIIAAVEQQLAKFQLIGAQHELEAYVAEKIGAMVPSVELVAFNSSGSEAVQVALRLARAFTGRQKIIRFEGHYHGWLDNVLIGYRGYANGDGPRLSEGISERASDEVYVAPWNDVEQIESILKKHSHQVAAIIMEPIVCNNSCLMPRSGYLEAVRDLATRHDVTLIFDEVITGFRVARGGAQSLLGVTPDLTILGKAVAGGFPLAVVAGKRKVMELIEQRRVLHAGTFNGHPISLAAAKATLDALDENDGRLLEQIRTRGERLMNGIASLAGQASIPILINGVGAAFHVSFTTRKEMHNFRDTIFETPLTTTLMRVTGFSKRCLKMASTYYRMGAGMWGRPTRKPIWPRLSRQWEKRSKLRVASTVSPRRSRRH